MADEKILSEDKIPQGVYDALNTLMIDGLAYIRVKYDRETEKFEWTVIGRSDIHCPTCQCPRTTAEMPSHPAHPEIKRGKSWHHG